MVCCMSELNINVQINNGIPEVTCEQLQALIQKVVTDVTNGSKIKLIDVRQPDEFVGELGHIKGAELIILGPDLAKFLNSEDKNQEIIFICRSGGRSGVATAESQIRGFTSTANLIGGMMQWNRLGYSIERE